jgi:hypothetical protein
LLADIFFDGHLPRVLQKGDQYRLNAVLFSGKERSPVLLQAGAAKLPSSVPNQWAALRTLEIRNGGFPGGKKLKKVQSTELARLQK